MKNKTTWRNRIVGSGELAASEFLANPGNWRIHPKPQQDALTGALNEIGWIQEVIVNKTTGNMVDGHLRVSLALRQGDDTPVPVKYVELTEDEERLALLTLDPIAAMAAADKEKIEALMRDINTGEAGLMAMLAEMAEANGIIPGGDAAGTDTEPQIDKAEELRQKWGVELGQMWQSGDHRLICGDCTDKAVVARVMGGERARLCHTDPPYGVDYSNVVGCRANQKAGGWREIENDALDNSQLEEFLVKSLQLTDAPVLLCWHSWRRVEVFLSAIKRSGWEPNAEVIWVKNALVFGMSDYQWRHETCIYAKKKGAGRQENRKETTVWEFDKTTGAMHPTQKPIGLFEKGLQNHTEIGDIVYEPFSGSGSQIIACENLNRRCRAVEIDPGYCAVALERWSVHTGKTPVLIPQSIAG